MANILRFPWERAVRASEPIWETPPAPVNLTLCRAYKEGQRIAAERRLAQMAPSDYYALVAAYDGLAGVEIESIFSEWA